jgi:hypothetical protein
MQLHEDFTGTVSAGTMRQHDVFYNILEFAGDMIESGLINGVYDGLRRLTPGGQDLVDQLSGLQDEFDDIPDADHRSWLIGVLFDTMSDIAPDGYYFGAHWGDGADYGFWPEDDVEDY